MAPWLSPNMAAALTYLGVGPAILIFLLLFDNRQKPGVLWFVVTMVLGGVWALLVGTFTLLRSPELTLALANVFWAVIPTTSVAMFLFVYEYVGTKPPRRSLVVGLFLPVAVLFVLSWWNPQGLIYTQEYYVDAAGTLHYPQFGGPIKVLVVKVYGYLLVSLATGMLLGEAIRTTGARRRQVAYLLFVFTILALSTLVKVVGFVPIYFYPTPMVFSLSGLAFAVSTQQYGFLKTTTIAREQAFEQVEDAILVTSPDGKVLDANRKATDLLGSDVVSERLSSVLQAHRDTEADTDRGMVSITRDGEVRYYSVKESPVTHYRGTQGRVVVLTDVTPITNRQQDLELFKQVISRVFRHNFRNRLNVIAGYAELIQSVADDDAEEYAGLIGSSAAELIATTRKAKDVGQLFTDEQVEPLALERVVDRAVATLEPGGAPSSISVDVPSVWVSAHPKLDLAIRELVENAVVHNDSTDRATVDIYASVEDEWVTLFVEDDGPGVPQLELQVLDAEEETDLSHGSGIGLWLVHWIVKRSNGDLVSRASPEGSRIGVRLRLAPKRDSRE
ncbi:histidine kinase N-terminal 7TM domain-containing protein [Halolamina litorea]|uniref:histidine kinase n=1 Tax=Halolamina litorea TaxID=1515593 RepID=A0ABD6BTF5_9EURY|nr:histidine kinase N-terminal 7TM domain-containing protein [Halolamina litorea]